MGIHRTYPACYVGGEYDGRHTTDVTTLNPALLEREEVEQVGKCLLEFACAVEVEWRESRDYLERRSILLV